MATECPHCFRTVIPLASGSCPNCRGNVKDPRPVAAGLGTIWIAEKMPLPEVCCTCGDPCRRTVTISHSMNYTTGDSRSYHRDDGGAVRLAAGLLFGRLFVMLFELLTSGQSTSTNTVVVKVKMPHCKPCSQRQRLEPQTVDFDYCKMRFVVCQRFIDFMERVPSVTVRSRER
jgi:hypothetical protein